MDPDSVTRQLGIDPIYSHQRGDRRNPKAPPYKHGMWALRTKRILLTTDLEEHIVWILDRMEPVRAQFMGLRVAGVSTDIFCFLEAVGHGGPVFQPSTLGRIAALDLQLGIEVFYADEIPQ